MTISHLKKQENNKNIIGSIVTGMVGAAVIAGAAVATTAVLKDDKTRGKVKKMLVNAKDQAIDYVDTFKTKSNSGKKE